MPKILDLDALYGRKDPIEVSWQGRTYDLIRPEGLGPVAIMRFNGLRAKASQLSPGEDVSETDATLLEELLTDELRIINPELARAGLPFVAKLGVLQHYMAQVAAPKVQTTHPKATGAIPTPG